MNRGGKSEIRSPEIRAGAGSWSQCASNFGGLCFPMNHPKIRKDKDYFPPSPICPPLIFGSFRRFGSSPVSRSRGNKELSTNRSVGLRAGQLASICLQRAGSETGAPIARFMGGEQVRRTRELSTAFWLAKLLRVADPRSDGGPIARRRFRLPKRQP